MSDTPTDGFAYLEHHSVAGERWDQLAAKYYGDATRYEPIVRANADLALTAVIPSGRIVRIPLLDAAPASTADLPPWKR